MDTNLLPASEKKFLQAEKNLRLASIGASLGILAIVIVGSFIWGMQQIVKLNKDMLDQQLSALKNQQQESTAGQTNAKIEELNKLLVFFDGALNNQPAWTPVLEKLVTLTPAGVSWGELSGSMKESRIEIKGIAATRDLLIQTIESLKTDPDVESVDSPLSNIVVKENIPFTITLKLKPNSLFPYRHVAK